RLHQTLSAMSRRHTNRVSQALIETACRGASRAVVEVIAIRAIGHKRPGSSSDTPPLCPLLSGLVSHAQKRIGIQQKLEIGFYFRKVKILESRVRSQQREIFAGLCFESHGRINAGFTPRNAHDFENRSVMRSEEHT